MSRFFAKIKGLRGGEVVRHGDNVVEASVYSRKLGIRVHSAVDLKTGQDCFWIYVTSGTCQSFQEQLLGIIMPENALGVQLYPRDYVRAMLQEISDLQHGLADMAMRLAKDIGILPEDLT